VFVFVVMAKAITGIRKKKRKRGQPRVSSISLNVRLPHDALNRLDKWIQSQQKPQPSRSAAMRTLFEIGLERSALGHVQQPRGAKGDLPGR
jgi:hypothetical protein